MAIESGLHVVVSQALPYPPSIGEWARRIVRHGLADVLAWLGEEVGPAPDEQTHAFLADGQLVCSQWMYDQLSSVARGHGTVADIPGLDRPIRRRP